MKHTPLLTLSALLLAPLTALRAAEDAALVLYVDAVRGPFMPHKRHFILQNSKDPR